MRLHLLTLLSFTLLCPSLEAKELPDANHVPALLRRLYTAATRDEACRELEKLDDRVPEARALLLETFRGRDMERRILAAHGLGCLGKQGAPAVPELIAVLASDHGPLRAAACAALSQIAFWARAAVMPALAGLTRLLRDPDALVREVAAAAIGKLRPSSAAVVAELGRLSRDPVDAVRAEALASLLKLRPPSPERVLALSRELAAKTPRARMTAAHALGEAGAAARPALPQLARVAKADADVELRRAVFGAIEKIGKPSAEVVQVLIKALKEPQVRQAALSAIARCAPRVAAAEIAKALDDTDAEVRAEAIRRLTEDAADRLVPRLLRACKDPEPAVRIAAIEVLKRTKRQRGVVLKALREALRDGDAEVRDAALVAFIGLPQAAAALPDLIALLGQRDSASLAASVLARLGARASAALPTLYDGLRSPDPKRRATAANTIPSIETRREKACPALKPLRADPDRRVRSAVERALKQLACAADRP